MRYDRMIATILALPAEGSSAQTVAWRQLVDLVAQAGDRLDPGVRMQAHERIATLRPSVAAADRRSAAASLAARATAEAVAIFAVDDPAVAAPVLARAKLDSDRWLALLPSLPATSRTILRNRRDLPAAVERALAAYGASDFALPSSPASTARDDESQIRNLVARIEAFRSQHPRGDGEPPLRVVADAPAPVPPATAFAFETGVEGTVDWIDGAPRAALIGLSIADAAPPRAAGVDGQAMGAFRRRAPFEDARLLVAGAGPSAGDWLISGQPLFDPRDGRFAGYRGTARRPRPDERAARALGPAGGAAADSLRQLVHELRTPLNAIQGFAQMIDQQMLGPAAAAYRREARSILGESQRLIEVVEDIDAAARLETGRFDGGGAGACDAVAVVRRVMASLADALSSRDVSLVLHPADLSSGVCDVAIADAPLERLVHRLLLMVAGLAADGETVEVHLTCAEADTAALSQLSVARPVSLQGVEEATMLDPGFGPDGEWPSAPLLGLGFSLRLLSNLARAVETDFVVDDRAFTLVLPALRGEHERAETL